MNLLDIALDWHARGYAPVPTRADGSKAPAVRWREFEAEPPTYEEVHDFFAHIDTDGLGLLCGHNGLEMFELEGRAIEEGLLNDLKQALADNGFGDLWERIGGGYVELTPGGGMHWYYRVGGPARPNTKLARRPATEGELLDNPGDDIKVLIETRGTGGFTVIAPSGGRTHPTGAAWHALQGTADSIPLITPEERDALYAVATLFDRMPVEDQQPRPERKPSDGLRPGDDFNARADWKDILEPHGWVRSQSLGGNAYGWTRPGKDPRDGISATTGRNDGDNLYVFSSSTQFYTEKPLAKFHVYAILEHGGDHSAAARALRAAGYGSSEPQSDLGDVADLIAPARPDLDVSNAATAADWLRDNLGTGLLSGMFTRAGEVVYTPRVGDEGYIPLTDDGDDDGPVQVRSASYGAIASRISYTYRCYRMTGNPPAPSPALFPRAAAQTAVDVPDMLPNLRWLRGVTHTPLIRSDGTALIKPGYDDTSRLLYLPDPDLFVPDIPDRPTPEQVRDAAGLLDKMTAGFPFVSDHDRANYYGLLLTPLIRELVPPPYKLIAIGAPQPGSGKTLLATCARLIHGGVFRSEAPEDDAELRKQITAILDVTTGPVVHFDNVSGILRSSTLAGLLTSARWDDRRLGANEMISRPNDRIWVVTGNNLQFGGDLIRRTTWVTIDPAIPHPEQRTGFSIPALETWVKKHRGELLHALLTLVRAWVIANKPAELRGSDGFARWVGAVSGILANAGVPGEFDAADSARQTVGSDDDEWAEFLEAVHSVYGDDSWTTREMLEQVEIGDLIGRPIPLDALPAAIVEKIGKSGRASVAVKSLGMWLRNRDGRWAGQRVVRSVFDSHEKIKRWRVEAVTEGDVTGSESAGSAGSAGSSSGTFKEDFDQILHSETQRPGERPDLHPAEPAHPADSLNLANLPGRCPDCEFHVPTQGHAADCAAA